RRRQRKALASPHAFAGLARPAGIGLDDGELADDLLRLLALVAVEGVGAEDGALHDGLRPLPRAEPGAAHLRRHRARPQIVGRSPRPASAAAGAPGAGAGAAAAAPARRSPSGVVAFRGPSPATTMRRPSVWACVT